MIIYYYVFVFRERSQEINPQKSISKNLKIPDRGVFPVVASDILVAMLAFLDVLAPDEEVLEED